MNVTVTGAFVVLVRLPEISPVPLEAIPVTVAVLSRVQLNTVPATLPLSTIVEIAVPEHTACEDGLATAFGTGLTTTLAGTGAPVQTTGTGDGFAAPTMIPYVPVDEPKPLTFT